MLNEYDAEKLRVKLKQTDIDLIQNELDITYDEAKALWDIFLKDAEGYRNGIEKSKAKA